MASLSAVAEDSSNAANNFAQELHERMTRQFSYLLDPKSKDFRAIFWVATYLCPVYRVLLSSDMEKMMEVKKFLRGKSVLIFIYRTICSFYSLDTRPARFLSGYSHAVCVTWSPPSEQDNVLLWSQISVFFCREAREGSGPVRQEG